MFDRNNPKQYFNGLFMAFYTMVGGILVFAIIAVVLNRLQGPFAPGSETEKVLLVINGILALIGFLVALNIYKKKLAEDSPFGSSLLQKLYQYKSALIIYLSLCEGPAIFSIISYMITGNFIFLGIAGLMLIAMFLKKPARTRIFNDLRLDSKEQMDLS